MKAIIIHAFLNCLFEVCELFKLFRHRLSALGFSICALKFSVPGGLRCQFASRRRITRCLVHVTALMSTMVLLFVYFSISEKANKSGKFYFCLNLKAPFTSAADDRLEFFSLFFRENKPC